MVLECNEIVIRTYQFIRLFNLQKYYKNESIPKLDKDNILYFIRACGIRDKRGKVSANKDFEKEEFIGVTQIIENFLFNLK